MLCQVTEMWIKRQVFIELCFDVINGDLCFPSLAVGRDYSSQFLYRVDSYQFT